MITFQGTMNWYGMHLVKFQLPGLTNDDRYYLYVLPFPEWAWVAERMAHFSGGRSLNWVKQHATKCYKISEDWPLKCTPDDLEEVPIWRSGSVKKVLPIPDQQLDLLLSV